MIIPIEFTFTRGLSSKGVFSDFYKSVELDKVGMSSISILTILFYIWIIVSVVLVIRFIYQYFIAMRIVSAYVMREDKQCKRILEQVKDDSRKKIKVNVRCSEDVNIPMGIGIFNKSIILPDEEYSEQELYYILYHEYTHFLNRDLFVKILIHIFCCVFWWNPIAYLLKKDLNQILEIKCDLCVTEQMNNGGKVNYLATIVSVLKRANAKKAKILFYKGTTELISADYDSEVVERFKIVSGNHKLQSRNKMLTVAWLLTFLVFFAGSYSFVILPYYEAPIEDIEEPDTQRVKSDNSYINPKC